HLLHLEPGSALRRQTVAAIVDQDHPVIGGQQLSDLIPLGDRRSRQTVDQHHRRAIYEACLPNQELVVAHEDDPPRYAPGMLLARLEPRGDHRPEDPAQEQPAEHPPSPLHAGPSNGPTANVYSSTGFPSTRCSSMIRSITSTVTFRYQVPSG